MFVVVTGGARSGKSRAAVAVAEASGGEVVFIATAEARDDEMVERIRRHRSDRPAAWTVVEEPRDLAGALGAVDSGAPVIVDCLALWVTNRLDEDDAALLSEVEALVAQISDRRGLTVVVTNEVGSGIVPDNPLARRFRDLLGNVNQAFVTRADRSYLCVAGRLLELQRPEQLGV